jgi:hypothetical protein
MGEMKNAYFILVGKPGKKKSLGRPRCRWKDSIKIDLKDVRWEGVKCMHLLPNSGHWLSFVNMVMNLCVPLKAAKFLSWLSDF